MKLMCPGIRLCNANNWETIGLWDYSVMIVFLDDNFGGTYLPC